MINNFKKLISLKNKILSKENQINNEFSVQRVIPKKSLLFGRVLSFSFDSNSVQMAASFHYGRSFHIIDSHKEYYLQDATKVPLEDFYEQCVIDFVRQHNDYFTKILLTVTGETTLYRTFILPDLNKKDLSSTLQFEVKKNIPFAVEDSIYDYRVIQKFEDSESKRVKISLHATTQDNIYRQLSPFHKNNLKIDKILHSHDTIGQLLGLLKDFKVDNTYTLINIGKKLTEISFYRGTTLEFSRSNVFNTDLLGDKSDITKLEYFAESIANEIQNSLDYYSGQVNASLNNNILLYGDFAYSDEFINILNKKIDFKLERFPIEKLKISTKDEQDLASLPVCLPVFATSVNHATLPDLLPSSLKIEKKSIQLHNRLKAIAAIVAITISTSWMYINSNIEGLQANYETLESQTTIFKHSDVFHTYKMLKQEIAFDKLYIDLTKESPSYMHLNLKELSKITPKNIKLFNLDYNPIIEDNNYFIQGIVRSDNIPPEISLAEFVENLSSSQFYDDVQIVRHVKKKKNSVFEIEFLIKMKGIV